MAIIKVKDLGKQYRIGEREPYLALRDTLAEMIKSPIKWFKEQRARIFHANTFWALKGVNFEVKKGEVLGIIGRNGAGKSTLLKILSQITPPTEGEIRIRGRVGSLLDVGTGFHPELTGRENVYLNGAILGMRRKEIEQKFAEIVEFSGVEKFLDTPVKRYSAGMYVRLAFAVAAHMDPEILIVDEVLAVGDDEFQKKCLGKMKEVTQKEDKTILFVSHNMAAVTSLCTRGIVLNEGKIVYDGTAKDAVQFYLDEPSLRLKEKWNGDAGDENVRLLGTWIRSLDQDKRFHTAAALEVGMEINVLRPVEDLVLGFMLYSEFDYELAYVLHDDRNTSLTGVTSPGKQVLKFVIPADTLAAGNYKIQFDIGIHNTKKIIWSQGELVFSLNNVAGIGKKYMMPNIKGRASLFMPDWQEHK